MCFTASAENKVCLGWFLRCPKEEGNEGFVEPQIKERRKRETCMVTRRSELLLQSVLSSECVRRVCCVCETCVWSVRRGCMMSVRDRS